METKNYFRTSVIFRFSSSCFDCDGRFWSRAVGPVLQGRLELGSDVSGRPTSSKDASGNHRVEARNQEDGKVKHNHWSHVRVFPETFFKGSCFNWTKRTICFDIYTKYEESFFKGAQAGGRTWDLLVFVYFLSLKQRLRPLGYCAPQVWRKFAYPD